VVEPLCGFVCLLTLLAERRLPASGAYCPAGVSCSETARRRSPAAVLLFFEVFFEAALKLGPGLTASSAAGSFRSSSTAGSFCRSFNTGANKSPTCSLRESTWSESKMSSSGFFRFKQRSTSSHFTGADTVGRALARKE
jgi:hypothetical protein